MITPKLLLGLVSLLFSLTLHAQDTASVLFKKSVYVELLGNGAGLSLNYDKPFSMCKQWTLGARVGIAPTLRTFYDARVVTELYAFRGRRQHHAELGIGLTWGTPNQFRSDGELVRRPGQLWLVPRIGYRHQKPGRSSNFRVGIMRFVELRTSEIVFFGGLSIGQAF